jgi:hypothetical protein
MRPSVIESTATPYTGGNKMVFVVNTKLNHIINDSDTYTMIVNFDATTDESGSITLKAGEVISDLPLQCNTLSVKGVNGDVPFRCVGV